MVEVNIVEEMVLLHHYPTDSLGIAFHCSLHTEIPIFVSKPETVRQILLSFTLASIWNNPDDLSEVTWDLHQYKWSRIWPSMLP